MVYVVVADVRNDIYESDEDNNKQLIIFNVMEASSTDIAVQNVDLPKNEASFGEGKVEITDNNCLAKLIGFY